MQTIYYKVLTIKCFYVILTLIGGNMESIILVSLIISIILGIILLTKYNIFKKIIIVIGIELLLYLFGFSIVYISLMIANIFNKNIDYNNFFAFGTVCTMTILMPIYCYCINKYKGTNIFLLSLLIATILFILFLPLIGFLS